MWHLLSDWYSFFSLFPDAAKFWSRAAVVDAAILLRSAPKAKMVEAIF